MGTSRSAWIASVNETWHYTSEEELRMLFVSLHSHLLKGIRYLMWALKCNVHQMIFTIWCFNLNPDWLLYPNIISIKNNATLWWSCKLICTSAPAYHTLSIDIPAHKNMQIFYAYAINYSSSTNLQTFSNIVPLWYARLMCRQNKNKQIFYANGMQVVSAGIDRQAAWLYYWFFRKSPNKHFLYCNRYMQAR